jgi:hypothetical protein
MQQSVSYRLLADGHASPFFFTNSGLFTELRQAMMAAVANARQQGLGFYPSDKTNTLLAITSTSVITGRHRFFRVCSVGSPISWKGTRRTSPGSWLSWRRKTPE